MNNYFFTVLLFLSSFSLLAQQENTSIEIQPKSNKNKGTFYFSWGYNKDWFTKSNIHFVNKSSPNKTKSGSLDYYDFVLQGVKAKDRPRFNEMLSVAISIPQYSYRIGYYFNDSKNLGVEINFDHTKYIVIGNQKVRLKGNIRGVEYDQDTILTPNFIQFEHTNGANFLMLNLLKKRNVFTSEKNSQKINFITKAGLGVVIPKTDVTIFGERLDNKFHIAGYVIGIESGLRYEFCKYFFIEPTAKIAFANYINVLTIGNGKANHSFGALEAILTAGLQF